METLRNQDIILGSILIIINEKKKNNYPEEYVSKRNRREMHRKSKYLKESQSVIELENIININFNRFGKYFQ